MTKIVFLDTETTRLEKDRRVWDVGAITVNGARVEEYQRFIRIQDIDYANASRHSLDVGHFYERHPQALYSDRSDEFLRKVFVEPEGEVMWDLSVILHDAHVIGAVTNFDTEVIAARMAAHGILPTWKYHLGDVENLAAGRLRLPPPWGFDTILERFGLEFPAGERHTAIGDARMAMRLYNAVMAPDPS